jgi:hypothetical protein
VVIAGYSFPPADTDARFLLSENTSNLVRLEVINPDPTVSERVQEIYGRRPSAHYTSLERLTGYY